MSVIDEIAAERDRQITKEGWSFDHDDEHVDGSLAAAASTYAWFGSFGDAERDATNKNVAVASLWPASWSRRWFKPKSQRRDLIRAAALIIAEIERLDRVKP